MSKVLGWLIAVTVVCLIAVLVSGSVSVFFDPLTLIYTVIFIYGLTVVVFGLSKAINSILGFKYLFIEKPEKDPNLSVVYKNQMQIAVFSGIIHILIVTTGLLSQGVFNNNEALEPALAVAMLGIVYPTLISGLVYYPLHKRLA